MAKFFVALSAIVLMAGCSCNKDAADTTTEAPATGDATAPAGDAATAPTTDTATPENMGAATPGATPADSTMPAATPAQ